VKKRKRVNTEVPPDELASMLIGGAEHLHWMYEYEAGMFERECLQDYASDVYFKAGKFSTKEAIEQDIKDVEDAIDTWVERGWQGAEQRSRRRLLAARKVLDDIGPDGTLQTIVPHRVNYMKKKEDQCPL